MAVYLKSAAAGRPPSRRRPASRDRRARSLLMELGQKRLRHAVRDAATATKGKGKPPHYPPLAGNQSITMASPVNPIRMVLNGGYPPGTEENPMPYGMPPFAHILNDDEVAAVVTYIRVAWGNSGDAGLRRAQANELRTAPLD